MLDVGWTGIPDHVLAGDYDARTGDPAGSIGVEDEETPSRAFQSPSRGFRSWAAPTTPGPRDPRPRGPARRGGWFLVAAAPFVPRFSAKGSGGACLAIVLGHWWDWIRVGAIETERLVAEHDGVRIVLPSR